MRAAIGSRLRILILAFLFGLVGGGGSLVGCHRTAADNAGPAAPNPDAVKQSFAGLKKQSDDLQQSFSDLGKEVEAVPATMPGYPQLRARFYQAEEARGVTNAKVTMLSGRLESALGSGKREDLQQVADDIVKTSSDARQIGELYIKLLHQVMAFQRVADQQKEALAASPGPKAKRSKSKP